MNQLGGKEIGAPIRAIGAAQQAHDELGRVILLLAGDVSALRDRLERALRPAAPINQAQSNVKDVEPVRSEITATLVSQTRMLHDVVEMVSDIQARLEI